MKILYLLQYAAVLSSAITAAKLAGSENGRKHSAAAHAAPQHSHNGWAEKFADDKDGIDARSVLKAERELELIERLEKQGYISDEGEGDTRDVEIELRPDDDDDKAKDKNGKLKPAATSPPTRASSDSGETFELEIEDDGSGGNDGVAAGRGRGEADSAIRPDSKRAVGSGSAKGPAEPAIVKREPGQKEFVDFYDKAAAAPHSKNKVSRQEVTVKRAPELQFTDESGSGFLSLSNFMLLGIIGGVCLVAATVVIVALLFRRRSRDPLAASSCGAHCSASCGKRSVGSANSRHNSSGSGGGRPAKGKEKATAKGDRDMAYDAHLHHYQQNKAKILHMQQAAASAAGVDCPSDESDNEEPAGDCSVYECPGLAPTGDIEVANPMFHPPSPMLQQERDETLNGGTAAPLAH